MVTASEIARWIIRYRAETGAPVDSMSLQKLLFYAQAFYLARQGEALFEERFKAWRHGPVVPQVWHDFPAIKGDLIYLDDNEPPVRLDPMQEAYVRDCVLFFSRLNTFGLSDATHNEDPWLEARGNKEWHENSDEPIHKDRIRTYYAELIADGEEAFSRHEVLDIVPEPRVGNYYQAGICVRKMTGHPLYRMDWTEALLASPANPQGLPKRLFPPITRRDFVRVSEL